MRPRERYTLEGPDVFGDVDLVALVLETGCAGRNATDIARSLLDQLGGLGSLGSTPVAALSRVEGVGPARAVRLHAACALARRLVCEQLRPAAIQGAEDAFAIVQPLMLGLPHEELHALYLNRRNALVCHRVLTRGNDAHTIVDPRQVFRVAIQVGASGLIVAHNHPSGDPTPSLADVEVTQRLVDAGRLLGVEVLDHLVVGSGGYRSLREEGLVTLRPMPHTPIAA